MKPGIFIDRDGTLIREVNYLHKPDQVILISGMSEAIKRANEIGIPVIVISNQSGVGRGFFTLEDVFRVHRHIDEVLLDSGAFITGWFVCPHLPPAGKSPISDCSCRKPKPGLFLEAAGIHGIDLFKSVMVGDKSIDIEAGKALSMQTGLVETGYGRKTLAESELFKPDFVFTTASVALHFFLDQYEKQLN